MPNSRDYCVSCRRVMSDEKNNYYNSDSTYFSMNGKVPYCKDCVRKIYDKYYNMYRIKGFADAEKMAIRRLCASCDIYYDDRIYDTAVKSKSKNSKTTIIDCYFNKRNLNQFKNKTFDDTILNERREMSKIGVVDTANDNAKMNSKDDEEEEVYIPPDVKRFFGKGFSKEDYKFLKEQYEDWTSRHECNSKTQEEIFKRICFIQLKIYKAELNGEDTKDLDKTLQTFLDTAKLQPKQNSGDTTSETQTFGTLLDKWEQTRPLPEIDEELKDVDKIAVYLDVFFRGHLAKMMGLKNGISNLYDKYMKKYTVTKPEYDDDDDGEALFDAIFGNSSAMNDD